ncbi:MAG: phospholipase D family protein [Dokdonella sp.]
MFERLLRIAALLAFCAVSACSTLRVNAVKPASQAIAPVADTASTRYVAATTAAHPGQSGFRPLLTNTNALMSRIVLADAARHSIDLQYYIFANDATGRLLAQRLLAAADRGVRVRILLDDLDISEEDHMLNALDAHPNIEVRLFNPLRFRQRSTLSKIGQFLVEGSRLNRRMHNKSFIVDGMQAIIGGRNIGDAYFDAGDDVHFRDLDVLTIGPVVAQIAQMFDVYWNSDVAFPVTAYTGADETKTHLDSLRAQLARDARAFKESDYSLAVADEIPDGPSADKPGRWYWGDAKLIADDPAKADPAQADGILHIDSQLKQVLDAAKGQALLISPYFIPGESGAKVLEAMSKRGVQIKVLTNSLAATDEPEVHSGYTRYRLGLLQAGVDLYELRPIPGHASDKGHGRSGGLSLHAKAMVVDHAHVFVGSMNFDPRSRWLNTEMGVIVDSPELAASIEGFFKSATAPANAFHVVLEPVDGSKSTSRKVRWITVDDGKTVSFDHDPETSALRRIEVNLMHYLPIEGLL